METMLVKDLLKLEVDVDIYDIETDNSYSAFVGPQEITEYCEEKYAGVLTLECELLEGTCVVYTNGSTERRKLYDFFGSAAGYVGVTEYEKLFGKEED